MQNLTSFFITLCCKIYCYYLIAHKLFYKQLDQLDIVIAIQQFVATQTFAILSNFLQKRAFFIND